MTHTREIIDHEDEAGHLVAKDLNPVYRANKDGAVDIMAWYCEGCADNGRFGVRVQRYWTGIRWTVWYLV